MNIKDVTAAEHAPYQSAYLALVDTQWNLTEELEVSLHKLVHFVREIPMDKFDYRYAEGKWTIKDILQHLIDTERIFAYRALRFARYDKTELPGYDENAFAAAVDANKRSIQDLLTEFTLVRHSTIALFKSFTQENLMSTGIASGYTVSVRALGFVTIGHQNHHLKVFKERYL